MGEKDLNRREFLKRSSKAGAAVIVSSGVGGWLYSRNTKPSMDSAAELIRNYTVDPLPGSPEIVIVSGSDPVSLVHAAMKPLGGMEHFIKPGDTVVLKPNIGWDRVPQQAANTNPDVVKTVVQLCLDAGAGEVIVTDVSCNDPRRCFRRSGIAKAAEAVGAIVMLPEERKFKEYQMNGELLSVWPLFAPIIEADKIINLPIVKHHNLSGATMGLKNWYGILGGRRNQLHQSIDISIADLAAFVKPTLTIMDAYRVLMANGPQGGNLGDVKEFKTLVAGTDQIAIDAYGATFLGLKPEQLGYLNISHDRKLGNINYSELKTENINLS